MPTVVIYAIKSKFVVHVKEWNVKHPAELYQFYSAQFVNPLTIIITNGFSSELMVSIGGDCKVQLLFHIYTDLSA